MQNHSYLVNVSENNKAKIYQFITMTMKSKDMTNKHKSNLFLYGKECHDLPEIWPVAGSRIVQTWQLLVQVIALLGPARMTVFQVFLYVFSPVSNPILPQPKYIRSDHIIHVIKFRLLLFMDNHYVVKYNFIEICCKFYTVGKWKQCTNNCFLRLKLDISQYTKY